MFFLTNDQIPEGVGFQAFGATHLIWLAAGFVLWIFGCIFYRKLEENKRKLVLRVLGIYIFCQEMVKNLVLVCLGEFSWGYLPFHLCGINILLIAFDVFKQTKTVRSFLYYFAIPGAALALLFPNWTETPVWNFFHIHSFTIHILLVLYPLLLVTTGQVSTELKAAFQGVGLLVAMAIPVYGLNLLWDTNFMFLMEPDSGNPLELFEQLLGSHLWGFPILLPFVILIMYLPLLILKKKKAKTKEPV
ncbi:MAG: TIGR02206 family membrane protein [Oscillospiraceae bacterium]|nr:TIGR02206 family membrane protein [Oscillospiraceae bacterium]